MSFPEYDQFHVITARVNAEMTQEQAGAVCHRTRRAWQEWELGNRKVDPAAFELFLLKTRQMRLGK